MFFNEEEMKVAEDLAWKMLDGWNHEYYPNLNNYAHFYFKDRVIFDPWMNEKGQGLLWPDHESKEIAVDPVTYYGQKTIEDYVINLFMFRPEWNPDITKKIEANLNEYGRLMRISTIMPIEVYIAMSDEQAEEENGSKCIEWELPESGRIYFDMMELPEGISTVVKNGWEKEVIFKKKDAKRVMEFLYPAGITFDYKKLVNRVSGNSVRLIGFGD